MDPSIRRNRYEELSSQLQCLEDSRTAVLEQLADLDTRIRLVRAERAAVVPLNTLPDDIIRLILEAACAHPSAGCAPDGCYERDRAITVSHVCSRWRQLAISTPFLWRCIHVTAPGPSFYDEMVQLFLTRSAQLPISIVLVCLSPHPQSNKRAHQRQRSILGGIVQRCWLRLRGTSRRWKSLTFLCNDLLVLDALQDRLGILRLPAMRSLHAYFQNSPGWDATLSEDWDAPALSDVGTFNITISVSNPLLRNITKLTIHERDLDLDYLAMISRAAPQLLVLTLRDVVFDPPDAPDSARGQDRTVVFPSLRQLVLTHSNIDDVLRCLEAPLLEMLWLHWPSPPLYARGFGPMQNTNFGELRCNGCEYPYILHLLIPSVTTLDISGYSPEHFLRYLIPKEGDLMLPHLKTLSISYCDETIVDLLLAVIHARIEYKAPLSTIRIYGLETPPHPLADRLAQLYALCPHIEYLELMEQPYDLLTNVHVHDVYGTDYVGDDSDSDSYQA